MKILLQKFCSQLETIPIGISLRDGEERAVTKTKWKGKKKSKHLLTRMFQHQRSRPCVVGCMWPIVLLEVHINVWHFHSLAYICLFLYETLLPQICNEPSSSYLWIRYRKQKKIKIMRRFRYMSHSYGILRGKAFKKLLRSVMQRANNGKRWYSKIKGGFRRY